MKKLPEHRVSTDKVTSSIAVRPKGDVDAEVMTDEEIEIENDAIRPKSAMDAKVFEEDAKNEQENETEAAAAKKDT